MNEKSAGKVLVVIAVGAIVGFIVGAASGLWIITGVGIGAAIGAGVGILGVALATVASRFSPR